MERSKLIHDVNPSQLSGASHRFSEEAFFSLREALLDARRGTVTHRASRSKRDRDPISFQNFSLRQEIESSARRASSLTMVKQEYILLI